MLPHRRSDLAPFSRLIGQNGVEFPLRQTRFIQRQMSTQVWGIQQPVFSVGSLLPIGKSTLTVTVLTQ
ncbi:MAG: hypothetical protein BGO59_27725 [Spirosoma sp. 48-14]|nr:MAG: hypothetical protein BGO59_27725 [Spirosoma sp. 48-14]